ncbi:MAG: sigma-70 family RNA polymerase sigma factor [Acidobacteriota bacterium]|nr:sigma-70 family RNA polymerase sigma factor [Acidobacteriota bacterium]
MLSGVWAPDLDSMVSLYETCAPDLRGLLYRMLASSEEAEETLQSIFVSLMRKGELPIRAPISLEAWMLLTARKEAVNRLRGKGRGATLSPSPVHARLPGASQQEMNLLQSRRDLLRRSFAELPAAQRNLLDLVVFEDKTEEEIASAAGEPLGRIRGQVRAALKFTRQRLNTLMGTWTAGI